MQKNSVVKCKNCGIDFERYNVGTIYCSSKCCADSYQKNLKKMNSQLDRKDLIKKSIVVYGGCDGNPGPMYFRGINNFTGLEIFNIYLDYGTNNISQFLAIASALVKCKDIKFTGPIYSNSEAAINWINCREVKSVVTEVKLNKIITKFINLLNTGNYANEVLKWDTTKWGDIPAAFYKKKLTDKTKYYKTKSYTKYNKVVRISEAEKRKLEKLWKT